MTEQGRGWRASRHRGVFRLNVQGSFEKLPRLSFCPSIPQTRASPLSVGTLSGAISGRGRRPRSRFQFAPSPLDPPRQV